MNVERSMMMNGRLDGHIVQGHVDPVSYTHLDVYKRQGVLALKIALPVEREDDRLMLELVAGYVAIIVYNAVVLLSLIHI